MGKQSKRKNKQRRGGGGSHHRPTGLADDPSSLLASSSTSAAASTSSSSSTINGPAAKIILKIRHGDPRVRHASLVALSRTLYDATSLENAASKKKLVLRSETSGNNKKKIATSVASSLSTTSGGAVEACNPTLLRALSERILDVDTPCATIAVGCLSNYISFYYGINGDDGDGKKKKRGSSGGGGGVASSLDEGYDDEDVVASNVMVPILLQRIQNTSITLQCMIPVSTTDNDAKKKKKDDGENSSIANGGAGKLKLKMQEQWTLLSLTLDALAGLIENCSRAVQRLSGGWGNNNHSSSNIIGHLFDVLKLTCTPSLEPNMDTAINALRSLHSLLDDNLSLIESIISTSPTMEPGPTSSSLHSIASQLEFLTTNEALPIMARLHACGSLLALRSVYLQQRMGWEDGQPPPSSSTDPQQLKAAIDRVQKSTEDFVLPSLYSFFSKYVIQNNVESPSTTTMHFGLIQKMMTLSKRLSDLKNDENVEMQVVSQVNARSEPARLIARRQKEMKANMTDGSTMDEVVAVDEQPAMKATDPSDKNEDMDAVMVVDDNDESNANEQQQQKQQAEDDLRDELDEVVSEWKAIVGSQKLALELVANITSGKEMEVEEEEDEDDEDEGMMYAADDDDDEHMWDSDDEVRLLSSSANSKHAGDAVTTTNMNIAEYDNAIYNSMMDTRHNLPMTLLHYFRYWVEFLPNAATFAATNPTTTAGTGTANADIKEEAKPAARLPKLVSQDVEEILSTCAICLGNVVASNLLEGVAGENEGKNNLDLFLRQLVSLLDDSTSSTTGKVACSTNERGGNNQVIRIECRHQQHVTSVLLSLLRNQPPSHVLIDTQTLDHLIALLSQQRTSDTMAATDVTTPDDDDVEAMLQTHLNITSILGVLCTNPEVTHPETTDRKVCRALLSRLAFAISSCDDAQGGGGGKNGMIAMVDSIVIAHEILNVLMDMYGNDDCHERVFDEECVLDQLRKCLPWFKRSVKKVVAAASSASSDPTRWEESKMEEVNEDGCVWNETALNATRFIKYKQDMVRR